MLAEALAAACDDREVLARIAGGVGAAAQTRLAELATMSEAARRAQRASWAATARVPLPPGFRGVDPSWIEAALADLPPRARAAIAGSGETSSELEVWLARWACAAIPPLPPIAGSLSRPRTVAEAARLAPGVLRGWLEAIGADQLAFAIGAHDAIAAAGRIVGDPLLDAARRIAESPRRDALGTRRAAIERCRRPLDARALLVIGARALAPHVARTVMLATQLAVRLPRELGLAEELAAHASSDLEQGPTWAAITAP